MARKTNAAAAEDDAAQRKEALDAEAAVLAEPVEAVEEPVLTVAEVKVEAAPVAPVGAIGRMVEELLKDASLNYFQIVERIVAAFPDARTSRRSVASVAADLRRRGVEVPKRNGAQTA
jgi:hypothetical protein